MSQSEVAQQLITVFNQLTHNHDELISRETLLRFLDKQTTQLYDRSLFEQLYTRMPKGLNGYITVNDYIKTIMDAWTSLKTKISVIDKQLLSKQNQLVQHSDKLRTVSQQERYNDYNISLQSRVRITLIDAEVQFPGYSQLYFILGCDEQQAKSSMKQRATPVWNEEAHEFNVTTGKEQLWIVLLDEELQQMQEIGGQAQLDLLQFRDQRKQELQLDLKDKEGVVVLSKVHCVIQWIHSQTKHLEDLILEQQQDIQDLNFDAEEYKQDIRGLFHPFQQIGESSIKVVNAYPMEENPMTEDQWLRLSLVAILVYMLVVLAVCIDRPVYLELMIVFYSLIYYMNNHTMQSLLHIKIIIGMLIISMIYDIPWLIIYTKAWSFDTISYNKQEHSLHLYEVMLSYILLAFKTLLLVINFNLIKAHPDKSTNVYDEQFYMFFRPFHRVEILNAKSTQPQHNNQNIIPASPQTQSIYVPYQSQQPHTQPTVRPFQYQTNMY